ncbi:bacteriocin immunity protein [Companilactobacillus insicii]|uniref:bacteriocin immunity protein n=1 Tax=Companilactobacillus insicii TaxID=1732567 RepID=UPI000F78D3D9|nr:bacteriocin immunity protein [Companilactobacillus insicii]
MDKRDEAKELIHGLYNYLIKLPNPSTGLLNITDVLLQVYTKIDDTKDVDTLINHLVNYIYVEGFDSINLPKEQESQLIDLAHMAKKAGWNGRNLSDFTDKSQFYSYFDKNKMPRR